jgi:D-alanine--poly(phosphoribitol) ligase subunit 2
MEEKIIEIIEKISDCRNLRENRDIDLLENEVLDSLTFIELITALEDEFNIEIQPTEVKPDTWRSITSIVNLVTTLK